jgi:hypothetical protein
MVGNGHHPVLRRGDHEFRDMTYLPGNFPMRNLPIISTMSFASIGQMVRTAGSSATTCVWGTANQARYVPFWLPLPFTVVKLIALNASTVGGNTDIGVYDASGNQLIGVTAATQTGTNQWQEFDVTDTVLPPGMYYWGLLNTTTTGTYVGWNDKEIGRAAGVFSQAVGSGNLPTTATFAALDAAVIPIVGISSRTLI